MNVLGIILSVCLLAFVVYQVYGIIKDCVKRKKLKQSSDNSNFKKEDK